MTKTPTQEPPMSDNAPSEKPIIHITPRAACEHDFQGWRPFEDGLGGERVCVKCGMGAMAHTLSLDI